MLLLQPQFNSETVDDECKYSLPKKGSPFKGLDVNGRGSDAGTLKLLGGRCLHIQRLHPFSISFDVYH